MSPEDAYLILEAIAEINGLESNLVKWKMSEEEYKEEELAYEIKTERLTNFKFSKCNIEIGEEVCSLEKPEVKCIVVDDNHVEYNGEIYSLSALAKLLLNKKNAPAGPRHFTYKGEILSDLRYRLEQGE